MTNNGSPLEDKLFLNRALEATIRIGLVALLIAWCFVIARPFIVPIIWGIIIAVAVKPGYRRFQSALGGRSGLSAVLFTALLLVVFIVPTLILVGTLIDGAQTLAKDLGDGTLTIPPPPETIRGWPIVGESLDKFWRLASTNLQEALQEIKPQVRAIGSWMLSMTAGAIFGILQFIFAIIIAGVLLNQAKSGNSAADSIAVRLAGERGADFVDLAQATVRSVTRGIVGVALIQSSLAGLGFLAVGLPAAQRQTPSLPYCS